MFGQLRRGVLNWFEDFVAYCDRCRTLETGGILVEISTAGGGLDGWWVKFIPCREHRAVITGRTTLCDGKGVHFS